MIFGKLMSRIGKYLPVCLFAILVISSQLVIEATKAESERVTTFCSILVDDTIEGQSITAKIQMSPATPTGEGYTQLIVYLKSPNGVGESGPNGPWIYTNISTDPNGVVVVNFDVATYSGYWQIVVDFGGHYYANNSKLYLAGTWETGFNVYPTQTPTPSPSVPSISPSSSPTSSPSIPEFLFLLTVPLLLSVLAVALAFKIRKLGYFRNH